MRIAKHIRSLEGYVPGEQPKSHSVVKLNTNENPYPPSPKCAEALCGFDLDNLRRYPDPNCSALAEAIARANGTTADRVFVGNGSDEILALSARAFVENDESIGSLDPSYSLYKTLAAIRDVKWIGFPAPHLDRQSLGGGGSPFPVPHSPFPVPHSPFPVPHSPFPVPHSPFPVPHSPCPHLCSLFLWTNPNAPTGEYADPKKIAAFARKFPGVVLVDEAYADFAQGNCMKLATSPRNRNVLVMRTFSKSYSLAGLRVGYCVGPKDLIEALYKIKDSYNVDAVAQRLALTAFNDRAYHRKTVAKVVKTRKSFVKALERRGWDVLPSEANFVFAKPPVGASAAEVFAYLKSRDIFVRYFPGPLTGERVRITIGTDEQMKTLLAALDDRFPANSATLLH